jgi:hypothetical protein
LTASAEAKLIAAARDADYVRGLTHGFYKYPARFSPVFARAAIETFTKPGDLVLDPYVGGGTTVVEARALGRETVGIDINPLAEFVTRVKSIVYSEVEIETLAVWARRVPFEIDIHLPSAKFTEYAELGYYKHLEHPSRWRLRKGIEQALTSAIHLGSPRLEAFGRCAVLRTAQWALDGTRRQTSIEQFRESLCAITNEMLEGARKFRAAVHASGARQPVTLLNRSTAGVEKDGALGGVRAPKLVVTSPPYPGVHLQDRLGKLENAQGKGLQP